MPNHVTSICTITGPADDVSTFADRHVIKIDEAGKTGWNFDFNRIIPMPAVCAEATCGSEAQLGMAALVGDQVWTDFRRFVELPANLLEDVPYTHARAVRAWLAVNNPKALEEGRKCLRAIGETGYPSWYEWSVAHWGTKWSAYGFKKRERRAGCFVFKFETAWAFPEPVFRKLAQLYGTLTFAIIAFDEGKNFACEGEFNGKNNFQSSKDLVTDALYTRVYGRPPT